MYFCWISEDVNRYRILQPNSIEIIIRRDVKFNENILAYEPGLAYVPSSVRDPDLVDVPCSYSLLEINHSFATSLDVDNNDENPPSLVPIPPTTR